MTSKNAAERESVLTALEDVLNDIAEEMGELPDACKSCPVYTALAKFANKLRKAKLTEEAEIARGVRERYNI